MGGVRLGTLRENRGNPLEVKASKRSWCTEQEKAWVFLWGNTQSPNKHWQR